MKPEKLSIICATLACLMLTSNALAEEQQSFIRKVLGGGFVSESIQTRDGNYAYLNGHNITEVKNPSDKRISEASLTFETGYLSYLSLRGMAQTLNGFVLVGSKQDGYYGTTRGIVVKVNIKGRVEWNKLISVNVNERIGFDSVIPTADGGFIVTGWMDPSGIPAHPVLIKFNPSGDVLWSKSFPSLSSRFLSTPAPDGGVLLVAGLYRIDRQPIGANVIKMNDSGNLVWSVTLQMKEFLLEELATLSDQGYLIAGKVSDRNKLLIVRLNADGTFHSKAAYSLDVPDFTVSSLAQTPDGGIAIGGILYKQTGSYYDAFLLKTNDRRKLTLQKRLGFAGSKEEITSVIAKEDGSYLLFGSTWNGVSSNFDTLFVGLNSDGLAPGCSFSHDLSASKVTFGSVDHKSLAMTPDTFSVFPGGSLRVKSNRLKRKISNVCGNLVFATQLAGSSH